MFIIFHLNSFHKFEVYLIILNKQMEMNVFFQKKNALFNHKNKLYSYF